MKKPVKVFISYSWDGDAHEKWVYDLAERLRYVGYDVILDQYSLKIGDDMIFFMENSVAKAKKVLVILTKGYKKKAGKRAGGVGREYSLINNRFFNESRVNNKFIPILRETPRKDCTPMALEGVMTLDLLGDHISEKKFESLLKRLDDLPEKPVPALLRKSDLNSLTKPLILDKDWSNLPDVYAGTSDVNLLVKIVESLHPRHEKINDLIEIFSKWIIQNPFAFKLAYKKHYDKAMAPHLLGFSCILPLSEKTFKAYKKGIISEWNIGDSHDDIEVETIAPHRYLLIQSIELMSIYWKKDGYGSAFTYSLLRHIARYNSNPTETKMVLIADGNNRGTYLLEHRGFYKISHVGQAKDSRPRYMLDFGDQDLSLQAKKTADNINSYVREIAFPKTTL